MSRRSSSPLRYVLNDVGASFVSAVGRMDKSLNPKDSIVRLQNHHFRATEFLLYTFQIALAGLWISLWPAPIFVKLGLPSLYVLALLIPFTSQFFVPATPVFSWLLMFFSNKFLSSEYRPAPSVALLPTLESVLYGANISDILTRFTHPILDVMAWIPYGIAHYTVPFVVAIFVWLFRDKTVLHFWARCFGYMNTLAVFVQIVLPCAAPWYEVIYGLTPANYSVPGSAAGLLRIDAIFGTHGYEMTFAASPLVFGAFPSLHAGNATLEALFWSHFFPYPWVRRAVWVYTAILYWSTMYLTHHYLIDVVGGACMATAFFYLMLPEELRGAAATARPGSPFAPSSSALSKHELYDIPVPGSNYTRKGGRFFGRGRSGSIDISSRSSSLSRHSEIEDEQDITYRSPNPAMTPTSAAPLMGSQRDRQSQKDRRNHRHTASIASLIHSEDRTDDGWGSQTLSVPAGSGKGFKFPPTPLRSES